MRETARASFAITPAAGELFPRALGITLPPRGRNGKRSPRSSHLVQPGVIVEFHRRFTDLAKLPCNVYPTDLPLLFRYQYIPVEHLHVVQDVVGHGKICWVL